jgi:DNA-binding MarR family transcriptional regulator
MNSCMKSYSLLWQIMVAGHRIEDRLESALTDVGLSLAKLNALRHLVEAGEPMPLGQLADKIACVKSNVTQLVDRLENDGLVRRVPDPRDRRSVLAAVTDAGLARYRTGAAALSDAETILLAEFPAEEQQLVTDFLGTFTEARV